MGILVIILLATANTSDSLTPKSLDLINQIPTTPKDSWLAVDKFHHFSYSLCITGLSYHIYHCQFNNPDPNARYFSISLAAVVGIGKELSDKYYKKTQFSYKDLIADATGIIVGAVLFTR